MLYTTQLVFGLVDGTRVVQRWRIASDDGRTADEYAAWLLPLLTLNGWSFAQIEDLPYLLGTARRQCGAEQVCTPLPGSGGADCRSAAA